MTHRLKTPCRIIYNPETAYYDYRFHFAGRKPHYQLETCDPLQNALSSVDSHKEMIWGEPLADDATQEGKHA